MNVNSINHHGDLSIHNISNILEGSVYHSNVYKTVENSRYEAV